MSSTTTTTTTTTMIRMGEAVITLCLNGGLSKQKCIDWITDFDTDTDTTTTTTTTTTMPKFYGNYNRDVHFEVQFEDPNFQTNQKFSTERDLFPNDFNQNAWSGLGEHQQTCDFLVSRTWDWDDVNQEFFKKHGAKDAREPYYCRMD